MTSVSAPRPASAAPAAAADGAAPGWRSRLAVFFALDDDWVRRPAADAARKDALLAVAFVAASAVGLELARSADALGRHAVWAEYLALVVMAAPIALRRRYPVLSALAASLAFFVVGVTMSEVAAQLSVQALYFFALFSAMAWARSRTQVAGAMGAILLLMFGWLGVQYSLASTIDRIREQMGTGGSTGLIGGIAATIIYSFLVNVLYFGGAVVGGQVAWRAARSRARLADQADTLEAQAGQLREHVLVEERLRIARELHDVVAHHVSVMGVQAAGARRVLDRDPAQAAAALGAVESSAREAVTEMRSLLGTLRAGEATAGRHTDGATAHRSPEPGVGAIPALVAQLAAPDFEVTYALVESEPGAAARVTPAVGLTLFRTVQEAVANVRRHSTARKAGVVVRVDRSPNGGFAEVEVLDDGRPRSGTSGSGLGLLGMRERVASLDGAIEVGPRVTGGYRVRVRLPLTRTGSRARS